MEPEQTSTVRQNSKETPSTNFLRASANLSIFCELSTNLSSTWWSNTNYRELAMSTSSWDNYKYL